MSLTKHQLEKLIYMYKSARKEIRKADGNFFDDELLIVIFILALKYDHMQLKVDEVAKETRYSVASLERFRRHGTPGTPEYKKHSTQGKNSAVRYSLVKLAVFLVSGNVKTV